MRFSKLKGNLYKSNHTFKGKGENMRTKAKAFIAVISVVLIVTAISIIIISRGPLYGKEGEDNWVPDMTGVWTGEMAQQYFEDVTNPTEMPNYIEESSTPEENWRITHQTGRVFAGTFGVSDERKLTGVIMEDRTVSIQMFWESETRIFFTGMMTKSGGALQISGYFHYFDDFDPSGTGDKWMGSGYIRLFKED